MKLPMNKLWRLLLVVLAGGVGYSLARAAEGEVLSPTLRQQALDNAKKLLAPHEITAPVADPFHSDAYNELVSGAGKPPSTTTAGGPTNSSPSTGPRTSRDQLQAISAGLKPSGYIVLGGQPTLLFGQKRVKAGGSVTITFEGTEYTVEITSIVSPNFTLRLNREEFTRPIK
jgi:hypothetical protein